MRAAVLCAGAALFAAGARAAEPVIVSEPGVAQYRQAVVGVRQSLPSAIDVDPEAAGAETKLTDAPVIVTVGRKSLAFARAHATGRPTVFCMVLGVSAADLSKSVTGVPLEPDARVVLDHIRALSSTFTHIGFLFNPKSSEVLAQEAERAARDLGVTLTAIPVATGDELKGAVQKLAGINALWLPPDPKLFSREVFSFLLGLSAERHIPIIGFLDSLTQAGALASVSPNYADNGVRAGKVAAEILARPEAHRLPVPGPSFAPGNLTVNLQTAHALGIDVSERALSSAVQVIK